MLTFQHRSPQVETLHEAIGASAYLAGLLFLLPFTRWRFPTRTGLVRGTVYFFSIGLAFMLVEAPLIQRFVLYLGHPSYATTVVLSSLLLGAGVGSLRAVKLSGGAPIFAATIGALAVLNVALPPAFRATLSVSLVGRLALAFVSLFAIGCFLGHWLPLGMLRFGDQNRPWFWAVNGFASVLATTMSVALAVEFGFMTTGFIGVGCYAAAWLLISGGDANALAGAAR